MATAKNIALASAAGVIVLMQFALFSIALDFVSSVMLAAIGFIAGRTSR